jgi:hypothetical protein
LSSSSRAELTGVQQRRGRRWGGSIEEEELDDEVAEKVADLLLLRLVPAASREVAGIAGK